MAGVYYLLLNMFLVSYENLLLCPGIVLRSIVMSMSVCLCTCLSVHSHNSKTRGRNFTKFLCMLPVVVARSFSDGVAICYALPVLWMTSCFHTTTANTALAKLTSRASKVNLADFREK